MMFVIGQRVEKYTGDYQIEGIVRAAFETSRGAIRFVVEHEPGFLHIYSAAQLRPAPPQNDAEIEAAALSDPDNQPLTEADFARMRLR